MFGYTIQSIFFNTAAKNKDNVAFNYFDQTWKKITYREFLNASESIAYYLIGAGISKGDRVAIISENRPEWCMAYMGTLMAGAISVPIDSQLSAEAVMNLLSDSDARAVFHSSKTEKNSAEAVNGLFTGLVMSVMQINFDSDEFREICKTKKTTQFPETAPEDIASLIYTSGTTGMPKGVMLTHRNFCSDAEALIKARVVTESDNVLSILPLHHTYPFMCTFLVPVFLGAGITYAPSLKGSEIIASIKEMGVTILISVPQLLELIRNGIINKLKQAPLALSWLAMNILRLCRTLRRNTGINIGKVIFRSAHHALGRQFRFFACGGARLEPQVMNDLEAVGFTVLEGYGLTETSPVVTFNPINKRKAGSVGIPLPSVEIKITDSATQKAKGISEEGEITINGPMVMKGYYKNPEATSQAIRGGWFFSGDLGYMDKDGFLFITGRIKEVIVLGSGKNVYPEDVEKEYLKIPLIKEIGIFGLEDKVGTASLHAIIVPDFDYARQQRIGNIREALNWQITHVSIMLPSYMRIKGFTLYQEPLPRTPLGKLRRFMIKDLMERPEARSQKAEEVDKTLFSDETGRRVVECIKPLIKEKLQIRSTDNLELDLGLDSLQRIELVVCLEKEFSLKLPETFASDVYTVGELIQRLKDSGAGSKETAISGQEPEKGIAYIFSQEPADIEKKSIGLKQGFFEWFFVSALMIIPKFLLKIFFSFKVRGTENIPEGNFIIAPNHCSNMDGFVIAAGAQLKIFRNLYFQGFQEYFSGRLTAYFARLSHVIPIDPETYLNKALQLSAYVLRSGKSLCIFAEGGRSYDGNLMEFKKGIGMLALELNIPVVPALIRGTFDALPRGAYWPKCKKVRLIFGKPFYPSDLDLSKKPEGMDRHQFFADELRERVNALNFLP
ncbi:MAG: AMP-binding protein [Nitrospirae bacterium]|nr:AMP-binding protein [Nitrospirota bacterium]